MWEEQKRGRGLEPVQGGGEDVGVLVKSRFGAGFSKFQQQPRENYPHMCKPASVHTDIGNDPDPTCGPSPGEVTSVSSPG